MKTLALLSQKGGSGKSTMAVHLAALAQRKYPTTTIIDLDPQGSVAGWSRKRTKAKPAVVHTSAGALRTELDTLRHAGTELCVIDTRPSTESDVALAAALADLVLIPSRPAVFDLESIGKTVAIVRTARTPAWIVLNAVPPARRANETWLTAEARKAVEDYLVDVATQTLAHRSAYHLALMVGDAVHEFQPGGKAAAEVKSLWRFVERQLWPKK
jgi:chromosome partitioning protein